MFLRKAILASRNASKLMVTDFQERATAAIMAAGMIKLKTAVFTATNAVTSDIPNFFSFFFLIFRPKTQNARHFKLHSVSFYS